MRKVVGYRRMDSDAEWAVLRELYAQLCLYKNFFQPTMKLVEKIRGQDTPQVRYTADTLVLLCYKKHIL